MTEVSSSCISIRSSSANACGWDGSQLVNSEEYVVILVTTVVVVMEVVVKVKKWHNCTITGTIMSIWKSIYMIHCVKGVRIRSYSGPHFSRIVIEYGEILRISPYSIPMRENAGKMQTRITLNKDNFYAVTFSRIAINFFIKLLTLIHLVIWR